MEQRITTDCRIWIKIDVNCLRLDNFVLKSLGGFGGGEESFQKIACRRMNFAASKLAINLAHEKLE